MSPAAAAVLDRAADASAPLEAWSLTDGRRAAVQRVGQSEKVVLPSGMTWWLVRRPTQIPSDAWADWYQQHGQDASQVIAVAADGSFEEQPLVGSAPTGEAFAQWPPALQAVWPLMGGTLPAPESLAAPIQARTPRAQDTAPRARAPIQVVTPPAPAPPAADLPPALSAAASQAEGAPSDVTRAERTPAASNALPIATLTAHPDWRWEVLTVRGSGAQDATQEDATEPTLGPDGAVLVIAVPRHAIAAHGASVPSPQVWRREGSAAPAPDADALLAVSQSAKLVGRLTAEARQALQQWRAAQQDQFRRSCVPIGALPIELQRGEDMPTGLQRAGQVFAKLWRGPLGAQAPIIQGHKADRGVVWVEDDESRAVYVEPDAVYLVIHPGSSDPGARVEQETLVVYGDGTVRVIPPQAGRTPHVLPVLDTVQPLRLQPPPLPESLEDLDPDFPLRPGESLGAMESFAQSGGEEVDSDRIDTARELQTMTPLQRVGPADTERAAGDDAPYRTASAPHPASSPTLSQEIGVAAAQPELLLDVAQAAELLDLSADTLSDLVSAGTIAFLTGPDGGPRFRWSALMAWRRVLKSTAGTHAQQLSPMVAAAPPGGGQQGVADRGASSLVVTSARRPGVDDEQETVARETSAAPAAAPVVMGAVEGMQESTAVRQDPEAAAVESRGPEAELPPAGRRTAPPAKAPAPTPAIPAAPHAPEPVATPHGQGFGDGADDDFGPPPGFDEPPMDFDGFDGPPPGFDEPPMDFDGPPPGFEMDMGGGGDPFGGGGGPRGNGGGSHRGGGGGGRRGDRDESAKPARRKSPAADGGAEAPLRSRSPLEGAVHVGNWQDLRPRGALWMGELLVALASWEELERWGMATDLRLLQMGIPLTRSAKAQFDQLVTQRLAERLAMVRVLTHEGKDHFVRLTADGSDPIVIGPRGKPVTGALRKTLLAAVTAEQQAASAELPSDAGAPIPADVAPVAPRTKRQVR